MTLIWEIPERDDAGNIGNSENHQGCLESLDPSISFACAGAKVWFLFISIWQKHFIVYAHCTYLKAK